MKPGVTKRLGRLARRTVLAAAMTCELTSVAMAQPRHKNIRKPDVERAENHAARAYEAYVAKRYAAAVELYLLAYEAARAPDILFNIARIYELSLGDRANAIRFYRAFIAEPDADPQRIAIAAGRLRALEDGDRSEPAPVSSAPPMLEARSQHPTSVPPPSDRESIETQNREATDDGWSAWRIGAVVSASAGLVALGVGAVFGIDALAQASIAHDDCIGDACASERGVSAARAANQSADIATMSFAAGGLLIATGATLLGIDLGRSSDPGPTGLTRWKPTVTHSDIGLALTGQW
jgi:hypothetical protein